uniref:Uncharacterized protein n=1 Tax=Manihot esculenta TaxID=3983 RepID=A0A2C9W678_MANES
MFGFLLIFSSVCVVHNFYWEICKSRSIRLWPFLITSSISVFGCCSSVLAGLETPRSTACVWLSFDEECRK